MLRIPSLTILDEPRFRFVLARPNLRRKTGEDNTNVYERSQRSTGGKAQGRNAEIEG